MLCCFTACYSGRGNSDYVRMSQAREAAELGQKLREARAHVKELGEAVERERQATALATSELEARALAPALHRVPGRVPKIATSPQAVWVDKAVRHMHPAVLQAPCIRARGRRRRRQAGGVLLLRPRFPFSIPPPSSSPC